MTTTRLRPNATVANTFNVLGTSLAYVALGDESDGTYVECPSAFVGEATLALWDAVLPAGAVVRQFQAHYRYEPHVAGTTNPDTKVLVDGVWSAVQNPGAATGRVWGSSPAYVGNYSAATLNGLQLYIDGRIGIGGGNIVTRFFEALVDVVWVPLPTVVVTGPSGTLTVNNPTVTWVHQPGADAVSGQDYYRVRVYDTATNALAYDTGNVAGAAASAVVGPLELSKSYRAVVNTMQTTSGVQQWSPDASTTFTLDVTGPTVDVTAPTGVIGTTSPAIVWSYTPGAGAQTGQTHYRIRGYAAGDLATALFDTGEVASSSKSVVVGPLDASVSWVVTVAAAQTTYGVLQWSPTDSTAFTIDVVPAEVLEVVPTAVDSLGAISVTINRDTTSPLWQTLDLEASYDGGLTWQAVRGATQVSVNGDSWTIVDHEAPNDVPASYRARATRISSGVSITSPWVASTTSATWHLDGNDVWIKDPTDPSKSLRVCISSLPELLYERTVGVFRPIGAYYPVVVSDVLQAFSATAGVMTATAAEAEAFLELCKVPVVLAQSPPLPWGWGSVYVALGVVSQGRVTPTSRLPQRLWTVAMTEVARPADETAT